MMTCNEVPVAVATWLSKGENLDLIYTNPKNHIVCFIPTYEPGGGDSTMCYFVDGRQELVHLPIRTILRELALQEGLRPNYIMTSDGRRSSYTAPKTYGPHLTLVILNVDALSARTWYTVSLTWRYPINTSSQMGLIQIRATFTWVTLNLSWCTKLHTM